MDGEHKPSSREGGTKFAAGIAALVRATPVSGDVEDPRVMGRVRRGRRRQRLQEGLAHGKRGCGGGLFGGPHVDVAE